MRVCSILFVFWLIVLQPSLARAERLRVETDDSMSLHTFLLTYRCAVVERLKIIHESRNEEINRFLVLAVKFKPQRYVQCLFLDGDSRMLCEASSGFYATLPVEDRRYWLRPEGLTAPGGTGLLDR